MTTDMEAATRPQKYIPPSQGLRKCHESKKRPAEAPIPDHHVRVAESLRSIAMPTPRICLLYHQQSYPPHRPAASRLGQAHNRPHRAPEMFGPRKHYSAQTSFTGAATPRPTTLSRNSPVNPRSQPRKPNFSRLNLSASVNSQRRCRSGPGGAPN